MDTFQAKFGHIQVIQKKTRKVWAAAKIIIPRLPVMGEDEARSFSINLGMAICMAHERNRLVGTKEDRILIYHD